MNPLLSHRNSPLSDVNTAVRTQGRQGEESLLSLVSFHAGNAGEASWASCRPLGMWFADELATVELHLAGPSGARVERLKTTVPYARLRWGNLAAGGWTVAAHGFDLAGISRWHAPYVRFRVRSGELSQVNLHFQKVGP